MPDVKPGDRVRHSGLGPGTVLALRLGRRARVAFDAAPALPRTVRRVELEPLGKDAFQENRSRVRAPSRERTEERAAPPAVRTAPRISSSGCPPSLPRPTGNGSAGPRVRAVKPVLSEHGTRADLADARQAMEALRLGVVPARFVREYTIARDHELERADELLSRGRGFRAIWGDYGAGKTHLLDVIEQRARERNFVTARVVIDPREFPPTHPKRLYRAVLMALRLPEDSGLGPDPLLLRLAESPAHREPNGKSYSRFLSPYLYALGRGDDVAIGWLQDYVHGYDLDSLQVNDQLRRIKWRGDWVLSLSDFRTYGRLYIHVLGTLAAWSKDAGFSGLLLLFDEVEFVEKLGGENLHWAMEALKHIAAVTVPEGSLAFDPEALYRGGKPVHRAIPLRFRKDQPLAAVFAFTPLEQICDLYRTIVSDEALDLRLAPLPKNAGKELVVKVAALYARAYPGFTVAKKDFARIEVRLREFREEGQDTLRSAVRSTVFLLDEIRLGTRGLLRE